MTSLVSDNWCSHELSDLVSNTLLEKIVQDAITSGMKDDGKKNATAGGSGATAYSEAVSVYLAFAVGTLNALCGWSPSNQKVMHLFGKQTLSMAWEFAEANILAETVGGFRPAVEYIADCIEQLSPSCGVATQADAQTQSISHLKIISTDPPYYDNIGCADLSDFFYVWLRPKCAFDSRQRFPDDRLYRKPKSLLQRQDVTEIRRRHSSWTECRKLFTISRSMRIPKDL